MTKQNTKATKSREEIMEEIRLLSEMAESVSFKQLDFLEEIGEEDTGFDASYLNDTADPKKSYKLYYGIIKLLRINLPTGPENEKLRRFVYNEKNLFLNRGEDLKEDGTRGSDGRMTYISAFLEPAFSIVTEWIKDGGSPFDIYKRFYDLNEEKGYHKSKE